jgi:hypothetical protein
MKTSDIIPGSVYSHRKTRVWGSSEAALVLETKLWTMGERWFNDTAKGHRRAFEIGYARKGSRAGAGDFARNPVGIPILTISEHIFKRKGENKIQETAEDLLAQAAVQMDTDHLLGIYEKDMYPKTRTTVTATQANGEKVTETVRLILVSPQTIQEPWGKYLQAAIEEQAARLAYEERKRQDADLAHDQMVDITNRVNALLGENPDPYKYSPANGFRKDLKRSGGPTSNFSISPDTLLALLELAEAGRQ